MSDFLKDIIKETGNEYASLVSAGSTGDVNDFIDTGRRDQYIVPFPQYIIDEIFLFNDYSSVEGSWQDIVNKEECVHGVEHNHHSSKHNPIECLYEFRFFKAELDTLDLRNEVENSPVVLYYKDQILTKIDFYENL